MTQLYTIVISTYNSEEYLDSCLFSIFNNLGRDDRYNVLIKDAISSDRTEDIIMSWSDKLKILYISEKDTGIYDAWNQAIGKINSKWISFLGSDDKFVLKNKEDFFCFLMGNNADYITLPVLFNEGGKKIRCENIIDFDMDELKKRMRFAHPGVIHNTKLFMEEKFDSNLKIAGDYDFILRSYLKNNEIKIVHFDTQDEIVEFNDGGISSKPENIKKTIDEIKYIRGKYNIKKNDRFILRLSIKWFFYRCMGGYGLKLNDSLLSIFVKIKN